MYYKLRCNSTQFVIYYKLRIDYKLQRNKAVYFEINPDLTKYDKKEKRSIGQLNYYWTFIYTICIYCTVTMAEVIFLTVRSEVMSLKRLYLRIYNYSVQITFFSKIRNYLTVINEYMRRFS